MRQRSLLAWLSLPLPFIIYAAEYWLDQKQWIYVQDDQLYLWAAGVSGFCCLAGGRVRPWWLKHVLLVAYPFPMAFALIYFMLCLSGGIHRLF